VDREQAAHLRYPQGEVTVADGTAAVDERMPAAVSSTLRTLFTTNATWPSVAKTTRSPIGPSGCLTRLEAPTETKCCYSASRHAWRPFTGRNKLSSMSSLMAKFITKLLNSMPRISK